VSTDDAYDEGYDAHWEGVDVSGNRGKRRGIDSTMVDVRV
jgi:hypothetical protein